MNIISRFWDGRYVAHLWRYDYEIERYGRNGFFEDREIKWILGAGVNKIENGLLITKT